MIFVPLSFEGKTLNIVKSINRKNMRFKSLMLLFLFASYYYSSAEGTRETAPNAMIEVNGSITTDIAALHCGNAAFNNFANYFNPDPNSRLHINIQDPTSECIFIGFSPGHTNVTSPNPPLIDFQYRIKDPNGNIVYSQQVNTGDANIASWNEAFVGPSQIYGAGGYNAFQIDASVLSSQGWTGPGDFYIEFDASGLLIDFWDISVSNCGASTLEEKKGRLWSYNWSLFAINDFGFPVRPFNGSFYVCAPDPDNVDAAFVTKIDFNNSGFLPAAFNVAFNSFGSMNTGDLMEDRKSVQGVNSTQAEYAIFLNDPIDLCATATPGEIELLGVSRCDMNNYCVKFSTTKEGQIDLLLDFDGMDNIFTPESADVMISRNIDPDEVGIPSCIEWDGLDGLGMPIAQTTSTSLPIVISFAQGIYHFPIYDAELMSDGYTIENIRPSGTQPKLFYDDSNIGVASGTGEPTVQLAGCALPCHTWINFTDNAIIGFGNLCTINSWWFSQQVTRQDVFVLPSYVNCAINGPSEICLGGEAELINDFEILPEDDNSITILSNTWVGPGIIGDNTGNSILLNAGGTYSVETIWLNGLGDSCQAVCSYEINELPSYFSRIDTLIADGDTVTINDIDYTEEGTFEQVSTASNGCDSTLTINVEVLKTVVHYNLNRCNAVERLENHMDYSEFTPEYTNPLSCAGVEATNVMRDMPEENKHSCTPGIDDSFAMCVSSLNSCDYNAGDEKSVIFEITLSPNGDTSATLSGVRFYEKAPIDYEWIGGLTGPNNYPTQYGIRVLANETEIFRQDGNPATTEWSLESYDFLDNPAFTVSEETTFRFELLGYCLIGNGEAVSAWDLDEISIMATCQLTTERNFTINGNVISEEGNPVEDVRVSLSKRPDGINEINKWSGEAGEFDFPDNITYQDYYLNAEKNDNYLNGVSTFDLVIIQKHLLGIQPFINVYDFIAADVNGNESVSVNDILELRRLILGIYDELPNNNSWRFPIENQVLNIDQPFNFTETIRLGNLQTLANKHNFVAVKVGDLNESATNVGGINPRIENGQINLNFENQYLEAGEETVFDIHMNTLQHLNGFQLNIKAENAEIIDLYGAQIDINNADYNNQATNVSMSWIASRDHMISENQALFKIKLVANSAGYISDFLSIDSDKLKAEAYAGNETTARLNINLIALDKRAADANLSIVNNPNPFNQFTNLEFNLAESKVIQLSFYSATGALLNTIKLDANKGFNQVQIDKKDININAGLVFYSLEGNNLNASGKMIVLE